jgi:hypothetical protein
MAQVLATALVSGYTTEGRILLLPWSENSAASMFGPVYLKACLRMLLSELSTLHIKPSDVRMLAMSYRRLTLVLNCPDLISAGSEYPLGLNCWQQGSVSASFDTVLSAVFSLSITAAARSRFTNSDCKTNKYISYNFQFCLPSTAQQYRDIKVNPFLDFITAWHWGGRNQTT